MTRIAGAALAVMLVAGCAAEDPAALCLPYRFHLPGRDCHVEEHDGRTYVMCAAPCVEIEGEPYCGTEMVGPCSETVPDADMRCMMVEGFYCRRFP